MNTGSSIGVSTMNFSCKTLISRSRNSFILGISKNNILIDDLSTLRSYRSNYKLRRYKYDHCTSKMVGSKCKNGSNRKDFCDSGSWGRARILRRCCRGNDRSRGVSMVMNVASDVRNHSTSSSSSSLSKARANEKSFDKYYIQGGLNVGVDPKPLVIDRIYRRWFRIRSRRKRG